jgi:hypothetical protein
MAASQLSINISDEAL